LARGGRSALGIFEHFLSWLIQPTGGEAQQHGEHLGGSQRAQRDAE